jgi:hypothetical protein
MPDRDEWGLMVAMATSLAKSGVVPRHAGTPEAAVAIMLQGRELGISPMQALRTIYMIEGKLTLSADLMAALIYKRCGDNALRVKERTAERCAIEYKRPDWPEAAEMVWTIQQARDANLTGKDNWKKYPAAMLFSRCVSAIAHTAFQDVIMGLYTPDEAEEIAETEKPAATKTYTAVVEGDMGELNNVAGTVFVKDVTPTDEQKPKPTPKPRVVKPKPVVNDHETLVATARAALATATERDPDKWALKPARAFIDRAFGRPVKMMNDLSDSELVTFIGILDGTLAYDYESGQLIPDHILNEGMDAVAAEPPVFEEMEMVNEGADDVTVGPTDDAY